MVMVEAVYFVEHVKSLRLAGADLGEHLVYDNPLIFPQGMAGIAYVEQEVSLDHFLEGRPEGRDEVVRKLPNEPDGVGEKDARIFGEVNVARQRIQRREKPVLDENRFGAGQRLENR